MDKIEGNISEVLGAIQQRREKLRNDSMERKKIIEDVMNRKKDLCRFDRTMPASPKESYEQSRWSREESWSSSIKAENKSYTNLGLGRGNTSPKEPVYPEYQRREVMAPYPFRADASPARNSYDPSSSHISPKKYSERHTEV